MDIFPVLAGATEEVNLTPRQVIDVYAMLRSSSAENLSNYLVATLEKLCPVEMPPVIKSVNQLLTLIYLYNAELWRGDTVFVSGLIDSDVGAAIWDSYNACESAKFELLPSPLDIDMEEGEPEPTTLDGWMCTVMTTLFKFVKSEFEGNSENFNLKLDEISEFVKAEFERNNENFGSKVGEISESVDRSQTLASVTSEMTLSEIRDLVNHSQVLRTETLDATLAELVAMAKATPKKVVTDFRQSLRDALASTIAHHDVVRAELTSVKTSVTKSKDDVKSAFVTKIQELIDKPVPAPDSKTQESIARLCTKLEERFDSLQRDFISRTRVVLKGTQDVIDSQPQLHDMVSEILSFTKSLAESANEDLGTDLTGLCRERALLAFQFNPIIWGVDVHICSKMEMYASILDKGDRLIVFGGKNESFISRFFDGVLCTEQLELLASVFNPKLIAAGPENKVDYQLIRTVCDKFNAIFLADLDMAGMEEVHEAAGYADVVITSTSRGKLLFYRMTVEAVFHGGIQEIPRSREELTDLAKLLKQFCA